MIVAELFRNIPGTVSVPLHLPFPEHHRPFPRRLSRSGLEDYYSGTMEDCDCRTPQLQDTPTPGHLNRNGGNSELYLLLLQFLSKTGLLLFLFRFIYFVSVLPAYMSVCHVQMWCPWMSEEGIKSPATKVTDVVSHHGVL